MPLLSFFSKRAYREVGRNWKGVNFAYLFLLLSICCIPPTLTMRKHMADSLDESQIAFINQIPEIQVKNGQVIVDQREPLYITRKDGSPAAIIDTTGSMNYIDDDRVVALLTGTSLIVRRNEKAFNTLNLSALSGIHVNKHIANEWRKAAKRVSTPLSYGIFLMLSYVLAALAMLPIAALGLVLSTAMRGTLGFSGALRIAAMAATPSIIFIAISTALGIAISAGLHIAITLVYLAVGIGSCAKPAEPNAGLIDLKSILREDMPSARKAA